MKNRKMHIRVVAGAAALACAPFLATPAAQAANAGWDPQSGLFTDGSAWVDTATCTVDSATQPNDGSQLVPNAPAAHLSNHVNLVAESNSDATNKVTLDSTLSSTGQLREAGGAPTSLQLGFNGRQSRTPSQSTAPCAASIYNETGIGARFTLSHPAVVTIDSVTHGPGYWQLEVEPTTMAGPIGYVGTLADWVTTPDSRTHRSYYAAAGTYEVQAAAEIATDDGTTAIKNSASGRLTISFGVPGTRTAQHKASHYVKMPKSRTCSTGTIAAKITGRHKLDKRIKKIRFFGPGVKGKTVRHIHKGRTVRLHATKNTPVNVNIRVRLRGGKVINSTASYLQCS